MALERFEASLTRCYPEILAALQPGLSDGEIAAIESKVHFKLTDDLKALYRWKNGTDPKSRLAMIPGHRFVPLDEAVANQEELRKQVAEASFIERMAYTVFVTDRRQCLAVLADGAGDGYFFDPARSTGNFFYEFVENSDYREFPALANFLTGAGECFESGIYHRDQGGAMSEDYERSHLFWHRYASWVDHEIY